MSKTATLEKKIRVPMADIKDLRKTLSFLEGSLEDTIQDKHSKITTQRLKLEGQYIVAEINALEKHKVTIRKLLNLLSFSASYPLCLMEGH